ncbi:unnamed protein product [Alopecurus aequalis]
MANYHLRRPAARSTGEPSVKGLTSSNRWSSLDMLEEEEEEEEEEGDQYDWLSNLPDDLLLKILERLDTADAARTSILSTRWKQIPAMLPKINLSVGSFDTERGRSNLTSDDVVRANRNILEATRTMLEGRENIYTIHALCMQFFLGDGSVNIAQKVANTVATKKVGPVELTLLTEKKGYKCTNGDFLTYGRQLSSFVYACPTAFSCLARLKLENLRLGESDFPKIFSISKRLEFLCLFNCDAGYLSLLEVEHPQLRELEILKCDFERVDLKWLPKLTKLTFASWSSEHDPLSFSFVPLLQTLNISNTALSWHKMVKLSEFLGQVTTVRELHLNFESEKIWVKPESPRELLQVFHKLRVVNLCGISEECDLNWTMFVLQGVGSSM